jgi:hypothetical protein
MSKIYSSTKYSFSKAISATDHSIFGKFNTKTSMYYLCQSWTVRIVFRYNIMMNSRSKSRFENTKGWRVFLFLGQRNILFRKLFQLLSFRPSENLLLFGSPDLDIDSNIIVFTIVHQYISQSKRFYTIKHRIQKQA